MINNNQDPMMIPVYAYDLIDDLDNRFPEASPESDWSERELWMYAGIRRLIRQLKYRRDRTEDEKYPNAMK